MRQCLILRTTGSLNRKRWVTWARDSTAAAIVLDHGASTFSPAVSQDAGLAFSHASMDAETAAETVAAAVEIAVESVAIAWSIAATERPEGQEEFRTEMATTSRGGMRRTFDRDREATAMIVLHLRFPITMATSGLCWRSMPRLAHITLQPTSPLLQPIKLHRVATFPSLSQLYGLHDPSYNYPRRRATRTSTFAKQKHGLHHQSLTQTY